MPSTRSKIQKKKILVSHSRLKVHFRSSEGQTFYWSIIWQLLTASNVSAWTHAWHRPSGRFSKSRGLSASVKSLLSSPPRPSPLFYLCHFSHGLWLVPRSLLLNWTETLATQGKIIVNRVPKKASICREIKGINIFVSREIHGMKGICMLRVNKKWGKIDTCHHGCKLKTLPQSFFLLKT